MTEIAIFWEVCFACLSFWKATFICNWKNVKNLKCHLEHLQLPCGRVCSPVNLYKHTRMDFFYSWEILSSSYTFQHGWCSGSLELNTRIYYCI